MADNHESCFLCKRSNPDRHVYYKDYEELEGQPPKLLAWHNIPHASALHAATCMSSIHQTQFVSWLQSISDMNIIFVRTPSADKNISRCGQLRPSSSSTGSESMGTTCHVMRSDKQ